MNEVLTFSWRLFCNNFKYILLLSVPTALFAFLPYIVDFLFELASISIMRSHMGRSTYNEIIYFIAMVVCRISVLFYFSSLIFFVSQVYKGRLQSVKSTIGNGLIHTPVLLVTLLATLSQLFVAITLPFIAGIISSSLAFLPSFVYTIFMFVSYLIVLYVLSRVAFAPFYFILEGYNLLKSIKASFSSTKGRAVKIVLVLFLFHETVSIVEWMPYILAPGMWNVLKSVIGVAVILPVIAFQQIILFKMYLDK